jgi:hypothetical protein
MERERKGEKENDLPDRASPICSLDVRCSMLYAGFWTLYALCSMLHWTTSILAFGSTTTTRQHLWALMKSNAFIHSREMEIPLWTTCMDMQCYPTGRAAAQIGRCRETRVVNIFQRLSDVPVPEQCELAVYLTSLASR